MGMANHQVLTSDKTWGQITMAARNRGFSRTSEYLDPILKEVARLEQADINPLTLLSKAGKTKER